MPKPSTKLSEHLPPLIFGTATFNYQFNPDPYALGPTELVQHALAQGVRAFDSSPYYGPSEQILGDALASDLVRQNYLRDQYYILTKVGRVAADSFDYSPGWVKYSVKRSCRRLRTNYLDVVYCHDVEFVTPAEVLIAVKELRRIRDEDQTIKYVGISGYPVGLLCGLAEMILHETGEALDAVMSYSNFNMQNTKLLSQGLPRLVAAGVDVVPNASPLSMGLLRRQGPPIGALGDWHPAPDGLREACSGIGKWLATQDEKLETVAVRFALESWLNAAGAVGTLGTALDDGVARQLSKRLGVSVMGVSTIKELEETIAVWRSILEGCMVTDSAVSPSTTTTTKDISSDGQRSIRRRHQVQSYAQDVRKMLGAWADFTWESPGPGFVNQAHIGALDEPRNLYLKGIMKDSPIATGLMTPPPSDPDDGLPEDLQV